MSASTEGPFRPSAELLKATLLELARPNPDAWIDALMLIGSNMAERQRSRIHLGASTSGATLHPYAKDPLPHKPSGTAKVHASLRSQREATNKLVELMLQNPHSPLPKSSVRQSFANFNLSERQFQNVWRDAVKLSEAAAWSAPGRRRRK